MELGSPFLGPILKQNEIKHTGSSSGLGFQNETRFGVTQIGTGNQPLD
jgi:hypothetical protein